MKGKRCLVRGLGGTSLVARFRERDRWRVASLASVKQLSDWRTSVRAVVCVGLTIAAAAVSPAVADAAPRFSVNPSQPTAASTITVTFKVPKKLPKRRHWILLITDALSPPQPCATFDARDFSTRGRKGQILKATFQPGQDVLDTNPTAWCTGSADTSSWGVFAASATNREKRFHVVAHSLFTIS